MWEKCSYKCDHEIFYADNNNVDDNYYNVDDDNLRYKETTGCEGFVVHNKQLPCDDDEHDDDDDYYDDDNVDYDYYYDDEGNYDSLRYNETTGREGFVVHNKQLPCDDEFAFMVKVPFHQQLAPQIVAQLSSNSSQP